MMIVCCCCYLVFVLAWLCAVDFRCQCIDVSNETWNSISNHPLTSWWLLLWCIVDSSVFSNRHCTAACGTVFPPASPCPVVNAPVIPVSVICFSGFMQGRENWKKSGNLSGQGKVSEDTFWKSQGKWKISATRHQILRLKCIKFDFRCGSAPDPAGGAYTAPPGSLAALNIAP